MSSSLLNPCGSIGADREVQILSAVLAEPAITHAALARQLGIDEATVRRYR